MSVLPSIVIAPGNQTSFILKPGTVALKVSNTSPYDMQFSGYGVIGDNWIPAGTEYMLYHEVYDAGQIILVLVNNRAITPANAGVILFADYYSFTEIPKGNWPITIPQSVVQSSGGITTANFVVNTGNAVGTQVIQASVTGDPTSTLIITNDGQVTLGKPGLFGSITINTGFGLFKIDTNGNIIQVAGQKITAGAIESIGTVVIDSNVGGLVIHTPVGDFKIDNGGNILQVGGQRIVAQLIDTTVAPLGTVDLGIHVAAGNKVVDTVGGVNTFQVSSTGPQVLAGTLTLISGSLSQLSSRFTAAVSTTSTFFNHGLGVIPDIVLCIPNGAGATTTRTFEYENSTMTTTQVKLTAGSSFNLDCIAIKF